ncbi:MAG: LON peptidase substrate-binding domain-containing protein [Planctomycetales bacterium]|nr:LON peptidase substrate-binding domain-containing protein [Planctomycetales bacterium]
MIPWDSADFTLDEQRFRGVVRLFPLPDLVLFPHVMQPLHIFEPRYLQLLHEALDSDGLIAMSTFLPGWEANYEGRPGLCHALCIGRVVTHQRQDDGAYNVMLLGLRRARLIEELPPRKLFREARVELLEDLQPERSADFNQSLQAELCEKFRQFLPDDFGDNPSVVDLLQSEASLAALTDLVSFAAPLETPVKYELLAERDVEVRARRLCDALAGAETTKSDSVRAEEPAPGLPAPGNADDDGFPPRFSLN